MAMPNAPDPYANKRRRIYVLHNFPELPNNMGSHLEKPENRVMRHMYLDITDICDMKGVGYPPVALFQVAAVAAKNMTMRTWLDMSVIEQTAYLKQVMNKYLY